MNYHSEITERPCLAGNTEITETRNINDAPVADEHRIGPTRLSRDELWSIATLVSATIFAIIAFACRWFVDDSGQVLNLLIVMGSLTSALYLMGRVNTTRNSEKYCVYVFAFVTILAITVWAPGIAFGVMAVAPIGLTLFVPILMERLGYQIQIQPRFEAPVIATDLVSVSDTPSLSGTTTLAVGEAEPDSDHDQPTVDDDPSAESDDPWTRVQMQFDVDNALAQNVTQWQEPNGTRCIVANIRCPFSNGNETCVVHLPFWPLLTQSPEVFCRVASGPDADIKTTHELPHGLRLEVRLSDRSLDIQPESQVSVVVEVIATVSTTPSEQVA